MTTNISWTTVKRKLGELVDWGLNPRELSKHDARQLGVSIDKFGLADPLVINTDNTLIGGHQRKRTMLADGYSPETLVDVRLPSRKLTEEEVAELNIRLNRNTGQWDFDLLANNFDTEDLILWGFTKYELGLGRYGSADRDELSKSLVERFIVPPFSVLDTRQGYWQDRKHAWLALGLSSELGRDNAIMQGSDSPAYSRGIKAQPGEEQAAVGTSIFDPVLTEVIYTWFCPPRGKILDPFAGGSVRGVVAGYLGNLYTGIDLSERQITENSRQAALIKTAVDKAPASLGESSSAQTPLPANFELAKAEGRPVLKPVRLAPGKGATFALELYAATSSTPLQKQWLGSNELEPYIRLVYEAGEQELEYTSTGKAEVWGELVDNGTCWIQFSGGKDSVAAAIKAQSQGYKVVAYHLAGLNRGMGYEADNCRTICAKMGWQLVLDRVHASGKKKGLIELPTKNQVSLLTMFARMAELGGAVWSAGWHPNEVSVGWGYDFSDGHKAVTLFDNFARACYPGQRFVTFTTDTLDSWATVANAGLLQYVRGCVCPVRFLEHRRTTNISKYGKLLHNRCGSCVKCAWEQIALEKLGIIEPNPALRAHGEKFMLELRNANRRNLQDIINALVPDTRVAELAQGAWPPQPEPGMEDTPSGDAYYESQSDPFALPIGKGFILPNYVVGDSTELDSLVAPGAQFDFIFSSPPFYDLEQYSSDPKDLSNLPWDEFVLSYKAVIKAAVARLRQDRFACFVVGEIREKSSSGFYRGFVPLTIEAFEQAGARFYNEAVLITSIGSLPVRTSHLFPLYRKLGKAHQNVLVFYKGNPRAIKENYPELNIPGDIQANR